MNKKILLLTFHIIITVSCFSKSVDSISMKNLNADLEIMKDQLSEVRRDQLNYKVEKDLLKETYENNYQNISLIITLILGIFGVAGYIGIRDISSIKKQYITELSNLTQLQTDIKSKHREFEESKEKYDSDIKEVMKTNEDQNRKIKILELKEKIHTLFNDKKYLQALEFCIVALELSPNDISLLQDKARLYTRTTNYNESIATYKKILELDPKNEPAILDLAEVSLISNRRSDFKEILESNKSIISDKLDGKLLEIFEIIIAYQDNDKDKLEKLALLQINNNDLESKNKKPDGWDLLDIQVYAVNQESSEILTILQNSIWYIDGQIDGNLFYTRTNLNKYV